MALFLGHSVKRSKPQFIDNFQLVITRRVKVLYPFCPISLVVIIGIILSFIGCRTPTLERPETRASKQSIGQNAFDLICSRVAYAERDRTSKTASDVSGVDIRRSCTSNETAKLGPTASYLISVKEPISTAIDKTIPPALLPQIQKTFSQLIRTDAAKSMSIVMHTMANALDLLAKDTVLLTTLRQWSGQGSYASSVSVWNLLTAIGSYPFLNTLLKTTTDFIGTSDLTDEQRIPRLLLSINANTSSSRSAISRDIVDELIQPLDTTTVGSNNFATRRDMRGIALPHIDLRADESAFSSVFRDHDADGNVDVDNFGRILANQSDELRSTTTETDSILPSPFPPPRNNLYSENTTSKTTSVAKGLDRDSFDRLLFNNQEVYHYIDLSKSVLASLFKIARPLFDERHIVLPDLTAGIEAFFGKKKRYDTVQTNRGPIDLFYYPTEEAPIIDLVYALLHSLDYPEVENLIDLLTNLIEENPDLIENMLGQLTIAIFQIADAPNSTPNTTKQDAIPSHNNLGSIASIIQELSLIDGFFEALFPTISEDAVQAFFRMWGTTFLYEDMHVLNWRSQPVNKDDNQPAAFKHRIPIERNPSDRYSISRRILKYIDSMRGQTICNKQNAKIGGFIGGFLGKFDECELFESEEAVSFFLKSFSYQRDENGNLTDQRLTSLEIKDSASLAPFAQNFIEVGDTEDFAFQIMTGIRGLSTNPSDRSLNRLMFRKNMSPLLLTVIDPIRDRHNNIVSEEHQGSLLSWEVEHKNISCPSKPCNTFNNFSAVVQVFADFGVIDRLAEMFVRLHDSWGSILPYEDAIGQILVDGHLFTSLGELVDALNRYENDSGDSGIDIISKLLRFFLDERAIPGLKRRNGKQSFSYTYRGETFVSNIALWHLYADVFEKLSLSNILKPISTALITLFNAQKGRFQLKDKSVLYLIHHLLTRTQQKLAKEETTTTKGSRIDVDHAISEISKLLQSPLLPALVSFSKPLSESQKFLQQLSSLVRHILDNKTYFNTTIYLAFELLQGLEQQQLIQHSQSTNVILKSFVDTWPETKDLLNTIILSQGGKETIAQIVNHISTPTEALDEKCPAEVLFDVAKSATRQVPNAQKPLDEIDFSIMLKNIRFILADSKQGLSHLWDLLAKSLALSSASK